MTTLTNSNFLQRVAICATTFILFAICAVCASAQAPPYALLQNSELNGTGNTFTATYLPVVTSTGTIYVDLIVQFGVSASGTLTVSSVQQVSSPTPLNSSFVPGTYVGPDDATELITVSGPGISSGGATEWSLAPAAGNSGCLLPYDAIWYDVGTAIKNSPIYPRLQKAGIKSTQFYQFGTGSAQNTGGCGGNDWQLNSLLGFTQTSGTTLVISSFTDDLADQSTPVDVKTYTLQPAN